MHEQRYQTLRSRGQDARGFGGVLPQVRQQPDLGAVRVEDGLADGSAPRMLSRVQHAF